MSASEEQTSAEQPPRPKPARRLGLSGKLLLGMGDKLDEKKGTVLTAGGYAEAPAKMNHYAVAKSPSVIQIHGMGPVEITYVDKADDPRNAPPR